MNEKTRRALDRMLKRLDRDARRPRRKFPLAPIYLSLGLILGYQLLVRFVPLVWFAFLPEGFNQAQHLPGGAGLVWRLATACHDHFDRVAIVLGGIAAAGFVLDRGPRMSRFLVWLAAFAVVVVNASILAIAIKTSMEATIRGSGLF
jgi:hypothetical protein